MYLNRCEKVINSFYSIIVVVLLSVNVVFAQRVAIHTLTNFNINSTADKFSFDIFSRSIGPTTNIRVGFTSYLILFNSAALNSPVLSNINPKYTSGSTTGDYNTMTVQIALGKIAVSIVFTGDGDGTGDLLSTTSPNGELICTVTLDIINRNTTAIVSWDSINSAMQTPSFQSITNYYQGSFDGMLPVELTSFTSIFLKDKVQLRWVTKTEANNHGFNIERRVKERDWNTIGFVEGHGNSTSPIDYSFTDSDLFAGGNNFQYRLKQIDNDGTFGYSDVVEVEVVPIQYELSQNYPNPFNPSTTIRFSLPKETQLKINIYNILGELVETVAEGTYEAGYHKVAFNASTLPSGAYIYRIESSQYVQTKKMLFLK
jgi:hypothetical protein